eukprot:TRINITY_DN3326_c0_g1_i1.p1 TRINITY_DN3326_c0_g1~~TRINITY_DN3326_c0_g1_i1.p1  ORF type:complete len:917 (+),score=373.04 TRINITY_DN3326_c0_g1_i1:849-3599(+)
MGNKKKKTGKNRLDKFYYLAKDQGFRSRAAFKLIQLNKKYNFLQKTSVLIDLCAAPGSWLQVASKYMPVSHTIIGVDLVPIKPIPGVICLTEDITTQKCRSELKSKLNNQLADVVLHDGAPNVGAAWAKDAYGQSELTLHALKLAVEFLAPGGMFVTKVFRSSDYNSLLWAFHQLFKKVTATKPTASRNTSAEIFVVCENFLAPKKIDPKILDPRAVFKELETTKSVSLFDKKTRRNRDGYDTDSVLLFKRISVTEFIKSEDPVRTLAESNELVFAAVKPEDDKEEIELISQHPKTNDEIRECCRDLKVLNAKDFRLLLKWREVMRKFAQLDEDKKDLEAEEEARKAQENDESKLTEEEKQNLLQQEMEDKLAAKDKQKKRKEKKKKLSKQKLAMRIGMQSAVDDEFEAPTEEGLFNLKSLKNKPMMEKIVPTGDVEDDDDENDMMNEDQDILDADYKASQDEKARLKKASKILIPESDDDADEGDEDDDDEEKEEEDYDPDQVENKRDVKTEKYLDLMYNQYLEANKEFTKKMAKEHKRNKKQQEKPENLQDFSKFKKQFKTDNEFSEDYSDDEEEGEGGSNKNDLLLGPDMQKLAREKRAETFFDQEDDLFGVDGDIEDENDEEREIKRLIHERKFLKRKLDEIEGGGGSDTKDSKRRKLDADEDNEDDEDKKKKKKDENVFEEVPLAPEKGYGDSDSDIDDYNDDDDDDMNDVGIDDSDDERDDLGLDPDEMDLDEKAEILALGKKLQDPKQRSQVIDSTISKYMFDDKDMLPQWFADDESKHNKPNLPVTKEQVQEYKQMLKDIDARSTKKVVEAKARKKAQFMKKLQKARQKAKSISESSDISEREKVKQIQKLYKGQLDKVKPNKVYVVAKKGVAKSDDKKKGGNVRVKLVDPRMKKEKRARRARERRKK